MKKMTFKIYLIPILVFVILFTTGCDKQINQVSKNKNNQENSTYNEVNDSTNNNTSTDNKIDNNDSAIINPDEPTNNQNNKLPNDTTLINTEVKVVNYFESEADHINNNSAKETFDKIKDKTIEIVKTGVDFIFYGKELNGITFNEMTDEAKERVINAVKMIDSKIMEYDPDYKETIESKYQKLKEITNTGIEKGKDKIKDSIGEETYNNIKEKSKEIIERDKEAINDFWNKTKDWFNSKKK